LEDDQAMAVHGSSLQDRHTIGWTACSQHNMRLT